MTWQQLSAVDIEESYSNYMPDVAHLTLENKDGDVYEIEEECARDNVTDRVKETRMHSRDAEYWADIQDELENGEVWVDVEFSDAYGPTIETVNVGRPDHLQEA